MTEYTPLAGYQPYVARAIPSPERRVWTFEPLEWRVRARALPLRARPYVVPAPWWETRRAWGRP